MNAKFSTMYYSNRKLKIILHFSPNNETPEISEETPSEEPKVYNYVSSVEKPLKWGDFKNLSELHGTCVPPMRAMWYYFLTVQRFWFTHLLCSYFLHYLPAIIIDSLAKLTRQDCPK